MNRLRVTLLGLALCLAACAAVVWLPPGDLRAAAAFLLLWVLPGLGWGLVAGGDWLEGIGAGVATSLVLALVLCYLPGIVSFELALATGAVAAGLPWAMASVRSRANWPFRVKPAWLALLLWAALLRLTSLPYSEFQGDEGVIMVRAAAALEGDEAELFLHQKGPAEILLPLMSWRLAGATDEFWSRLPFAWISILGVAAVAGLGAAWFGRRAGLIAGFILAISGLQVAFGRIVQYQGLVMLMALLALREVDRFCVSGRSRHLLLAALFLGAGALCHYDVVLFLPAVLAMLVGRKARAHIRYRQLLLAGLLGAAVVGLFYLPFVLNPSFGKTAAYLAGGRIGGGLHWNGGKLWVMSTVYNSSYFVGALALLIGAHLLPAVRRRRPVPRASWAVLLGPLLFYLLFVSDPRTHVYTLFPGAALLAGSSVDALFDLGSGGLRRAIVLGAASGLYVLCAAYTWMVFVDHDPEYIRTFPDHKSPVFWTSYDEIPLFGRFGFPHRAGWNAVSSLKAQGALPGIYASNEEQEITDWYMRQAPRTHCPDPDLYLVAARVQDEVPIDWDDLRNRYVLAGTIDVAGEPRLRWYTRDSAGVVAVGGDRARQWWVPAEVVPSAYAGEQPVGVTLGGQVRLLGYDLDSGAAVAGGRVKLTLYWEALMPLARNYQVFTHLYDGQMRGQDDGAPECAMNPTTRWEPGQIVPDPHALTISAATPAGPIPLLVGMYDLLTGDRLEVPGTDGNAIHLTAVWITEAVD